MAPDSLANADVSFGEKIIAVRDKWHTKNHPLFTTLATGKLDIRVLGIHQAMHTKFVVLALEAFGLLYTRGDREIKKMCVENLAEEEGLIAQDSVGEDPHEHIQMLYNFCLATGLSQAEIDDMEMLPSWWARTLYYRHIADVEPIGVALAALFTQEGQQRGPQARQHFGPASLAPMTERRRQRGCAYRTAVRPGPVVPAKEAAGCA